MNKLISTSSVADPDPGWVKIRIRDEHPGSATVLTSDIFWVKSSIILENWSKYFLQHFKNQIIFNFVKFVDTKTRNDNKFVFTMI